MHGYWYLNVAAALAVVGTLLVLLNLFGWTPRLPRRRGRRRRPKATRVASDPNRWPHNADWPGWPGPWPM